MKRRPIPKKHLNHDIAYPPRHRQPNLLFADSIYRAVHGTPPPDNWTLEDAIKLMMAKRLIIT